jgi:hypothetical protein
MNGFKYYASGALFIALCLLDAFFGLMLLAIFDKGAGAVVFILVVLASFLFATKKCYSYHKKIDYVKKPAAKPVVVSHEEEKGSDEPLWMSNNNGINVQPIVHNGGNAMQDNNFKITLSGDSGSDYDAVVEIKNSKLFVRCGCPAGQSLMRCKHALSLLKKDFSRVNDPTEKAKVSEFFNSFKMLPQDAAIANEIEEIEKQEKILKEKKKALKKQMDRIFFEGIPVE